MSAASKKPSPYGNKKFTSIEEYHGSFPSEIRQKLEQMHDIIKSAAGGAEEVISYNMPAFKKGSVLVYYAGYSRHIGFYPTATPMIAFKEELLEYKTSKGAVQFPLDKELPVSLIKKMVKFRVKEVAEKKSGK